MLKETRLRLSRKYDVEILQELEDAINHTPLVGWPERVNEFGSKYTEYTFLFSYPNSTSNEREEIKKNTDEGATSWYPSDRMIKTLQSLFQSDSFSVKIVLNKLDIVDVEDRRG